MRLSDTFLRGKHSLTHAFLMHGITKIDECARDPEGTSRINVDSLCRMIDDLLDAGVTPIFTSSDAVFDGTRGLWTEEDATNPILTYGRQKATVEQYLRGKRAPWVIARLSKVVGSDSDTHSLLGEWMKSLEAGEAIRCAHDQVFSPAHVEDVVAALISLAEKDLKGIFHVCGPEPLSRIEFLKMYVSEIQRYRDIRSEIIPCSIRDFPFLEPRPFDTSLSPVKLYATLGAPFQTMKMICERIGAQRYDRPAAMVEDTSTAHNESE